ncbi:MAG TPA: cytochrome c [Lutibacter sp.]|nr:cytochrome c [Lutibacter sp.]
MRTVKILMIIGIISIGLFSFTKLTQEEWKVPAKYQTMKNTVEASKANIALGKSLYAKHCKSCHGNTGLGDGTKAKEVEGDLGDFSSKKFQAQSDGAIFYKSYIGRKDMPNYEKKITEKDDVWALVHYIRTLKK